MRLFQQAPIVFSILALTLLVSCQKPVSTGSQGPSPLSACPSGTCGTDCKETDCSPLISEHFHLEIDPATSGYIPQFILDVPLNQDLSNIRLKERYFFYGSIALSDSSRPTTSGASVPTRRDIFATIPDIVAIPQVPDELSTSAASYVISRLNNIPATMDRTHGTFTLELIADQDYQIVINPHGLSSLPPSFFPTKISTDHNAAISLSNQGTLLSGKLTFANHSSNELANQISVGIYQNNQLVSSVGKITAQGTFSVQLSDPLYHEIDSRHRLIMVADLEESFSYLPLVRERIEINDSDLTNHNIALTEIRVPETSRPIDFTMLVSGEEGNPVNGARVYLKSKFGDYVSDIQLQANAEGRISGRVMAGQYKLAIIPPPDSPYAMHHENQFDILESGQTATITLSKREALEGTLLDDRGYPVQGALVQLTRFAREESNRPENVLKDTPVRIEARSDKDGHWCTQSPGATSDSCHPVLLDKGRYRLLVIPPPGAELPIYTSTFDFPEQSSLSIGLKKPRRIHGKILGPTGEIPIASAFVKAYSTTLELEVGEPFLLGQTITQSTQGSAGEFTIFVSPE